MSVIEETTLEKVRDDRTYTQRSFLDFDMKPYKILVVDAAEGEPEFLPFDKIVILKRYKRNIVRGRKDPLKGRNVLCLPSDKGHIMLPLEESLAFANMLQALSEKISEKLKEESPALSEQSQI
jgi:hypothetical protein